MRLPPLVPGRFVQRDNRFRVTVEVDGGRVAAHLPNSGRLAELLSPGRPCWLAHRGGVHRKTSFDLLLVAHAGVLVSVDARLPNGLMAEALSAGVLRPFRQAAGLRREVRLGQSRIDLLLHGPAGDCWVETKSVTLVEEGVARFPDAPTSRGARHLRELTGVVEGGGRAAVVFVIQRPDAVRFEPHARADEPFAAALARAAAAGVGVYAWTCRVSVDEIRIAEPIPVEV